MTDDQFNQLVALGEAYQAIDDARHKLEEAREKLAHAGVPVFKQGRLTSAAEKVGLALAHVGMMVLGEKEKSDG